MISQAKFYLWVALCGLSFVKIISFKKTMKKVEKYEDTKETTKE